MATISVDFKIEKQNVFGEVEKLTAYFGAKVAPDGSGYEQIALTETQYEMLDSFWRMAKNAVTDVVKPYISQITESSTDDVDFVLAMPSNWNGHLKIDVVETAKSYMVQYIAGMWFRVATDQASGVDNESKHIEDAIALIGQLKRKIYDRVRPKRPTYDDPVVEEPEDPVEEDDDNAGADEETDEASGTGGDNMIDNAGGNDLDDLQNPAWNINPDLFPRTEGLNDVAP